MFNINNLTSEFWCKESAILLDSDNQMHREDCNSTSGTKFVNPCENLFPEIKFSGNFVNIFKSWKSKSRVTNTYKKGEQLLPKERFNIKGIYGVKRPSDYYDIDFTKERKISYHIPGEIVRHILQYLPLNFKSSVDLLLVNKEWYIHCLSCSLFRALLSEEADIFNNGLWKPLGLYDLEIIKRSQRSRNRGIERFIIKNASMKPDLFQHLFYKTYTDLSESITIKIPEEKQSISYLNIKWLKEEREELQKVMKIVTTLEEVDCSLMNDSTLVTKFLLNTLFEDQVVIEYLNTLSVDGERLKPLDFKSHAIVWILNDNVFDSDHMSYDNICNNWAFDREIALAKCFICKYSDITEEGVYRNDREIVFFVLNRRGYVFENMSLEMKRDREIVMAAIKNYPSAITYADPIFKKDKRMALKLAGCYEDTLKYIDKELAKDEEILLKVLKFEGKKLKEISKKIQTKNMVLAAVKNNGLALQFASKKFKRDKEVVFYAVFNNSVSLKYAAEELKEDKTFELEVEHSKKFWKWQGQ